MVIKSLYMARREAASYNKSDYSFLLFILCVVIFAYFFGSIYFGLTLFTEITAVKALFISTVVSAIPSALTVLRWCWYVSKDDAGLIKNKQVIRPAKLSKHEIAEDFVKECRK